MMKAFIKALQLAFEYQGYSSKMVYVSEFNVSRKDRVEYTSDSDRLEQFYELVGIEMNALTDGDARRVLDILNALDMDYDFASKQGVSMAAYYGKRADSEKTQRQRLFKKIKEKAARDNPE